MISSLKITLKTLSYNIVKGALRGASSYNPLPSLGNSVFTSDFLCADLRTLTRDPHIFIVATSSSGSCTLTLLHTYLISSTLSTIQEDRPTSLSVISTVCVLCKKDNTLTYPGSLEDDMDI